MESGGFEENTDGYNSFSSKMVTPIFTAVSQCREQLRFRFSHLGHKVSLKFLGLCHITQCDDRHKQSRK